MTIDKEMKRGNGRWRRLGVVLTVIWIVCGTYWLYEQFLHDQFRPINESYQNCSNFAADYSANDPSMVKYTAAMKQCTNDMNASYEKSTAAWLLLGYGFAGALIIAALIWALVGLVLRVISWVLWGRRGDTA